MSNLKIKVLSALQRSLPNADLIQVTKNEGNVINFKWRNSSFRISFGGTYCISEIEGVHSHSTDKSMILDALIQKTMESSK